MAHSTVSLLCGYIVWLALLHRYYFAWLLVSGAIQLAAMTLFTLVAAVTVFPESNVSAESVLGARSTALTLC